MFESIFKTKATSSNKLIVGDPEGHVAIVTLWSKVKEMKEKIDPSKYCIMGQLFSAERGLDLLVRNLLANPQLTNIIVTGVDFSKSGIVLEDFFRNGFERGETKITKKPVWKVKSDYEGYIDMDIPGDVLEELKQSVSVVRVADLSNFDFSTLQRPIGKREKRIYEKKEEEVKQYVGDYTGYVIRGKTITEAWLNVLDTILKFGKESETHYDEPQREVLNLLSIIEGEDPNHFFIPDYLPCDEPRVRSYVPRITRDLPGGIHKNEYTYGSRMRSWFGTDQVRRAVDKLAREPVSRAVVVGLWDATKDLEIGGSPCLNHIWLRISDDKLYMTCIFRSHDMFEGYPENAFGLRTLQEEIRAELQQRLGKEVGLGELMILSQSAHLYKDTWEWAQKITQKHLPQYRRHMSQTDPRGNFLITTENKEIMLEHTSPGGEKINQFKFKNGFELRDILAQENVISNVPHAFDLGLQVMKAQVANTLGLEFNQDQPLEFEQASKIAAPVPISNADTSEPAASPTEPAKGVIKDGIIQPEHQKKLYPRVLQEARIDSFSFWD